MHKVPADLIKQASYINGQWLTGNHTFDIINKASGEVITQVVDASADDATRAVEAAAKAFPEWAALTGAKRGELLYRWYQLMMENQQALGRLMTLEQGKPLAEAEGEIAYGAGYVKWFAGEAERAYGAMIPAANPGEQIQAVRKPLGVAAAITPWNFPNAMIARKAAAALAAGCTFVVRPASKTPLSALAMAELAERAGIPAGVFNVVAGTDSAGIGKVLTTHPSIAKFSFTGSTPVGRKLAKACASTIKKVSMELGGNAPFIVFDDADIDAAVEGAMLCKFRNAGQTCVCANRFYVQASVAEEFTTKLLAKIKALKVGDGTEDGVDIGPLISEEAAADVHKLVDESVKQGAKLIYGGDWQQGAYYPPTLVTALSADMPLFSEEIFGPVAAIQTFETEQQALQLANDTIFGLASYFYARDIGRIQRVADGLEYGMVGINSGAISNPAAPFGGVKQSGYGREGSLYGLDDYTSIQYRLVAGGGY